MIGARINLTTSARIKSELKLTRWGSTGEALVDLLIPIVSEMVEDALNRVAKSQVLTEFFDADGRERTYHLSGWPVATSPALKLLFDIDQVFTDPDHLVVADDYVIDEDGRVRLKWGHAIVSHEEVYPHAIKFIYTGGMAADQPSFELAFPNLVGAVDLQVMHLYHHRDKLGVESVSAAGGGAVTITKPIGKLLPIVRQMIKSEKRGSDFIG